MLDKILFDANIGSRLLAVVGLLVMSSTASGDEIFHDRFQLEFFQDCENCPQMVKISGGQFVMGSSPDEPGSLLRERPQHVVNVPSFGLSRTPITVSQWALCVDDGACTEVPRPFPEGDYPAVNVNWHNAHQYVQWLSDISGRAYRLASESEWEYGARARTTGRFSTGDCITSDQANFNGSTPPDGCPAGISRGFVLPVATFPPNGFGLYDVHGNVWEWVQDCENIGSIVFGVGGYEGAPDDGSAWMTGNCDRAMVRGGAWLNGGGGIRSAMRLSADRNDASENRSFRVATSEVP